MCCCTIDTHSDFDWNTSIGPVPACCFIDNSLEHPSRQRKFIYFIFTIFVWQFPEQQPKSIPSKLMHINFAISEPIKFHCARDVCVNSSIDSGGDLLLFHPVALKPLERRISMLFSIPSNIHHSVAYLFRLVQTLSIQLVDSSCCWTNHISFVPFNKLILKSMETQRFRRSEVIFPKPSGLFERTYIEKYR